MKILFPILLLTISSVLNAFEGVASADIGKEAETEALQAEALAENLFNTSLEDLMFIKVSGATLTEQNLKTVPSSVTVFSHEQIQHLGLHYLYELMNFVPGFQSFRSSYAPQHTSFSSRGRTVGGLGAEVLLLIDGQRIDEPRTSGSVIIGGKIPLLNIKRVEFIRGPGSAVYGSNAMLGVINIISREGVNEVGASLGEFSYEETHLFASKQYNDFKINLFAHAQNESGDTYNVPDRFDIGRTNTSDPIEASSLNFRLQWQKSSFNFQRYRTEAEDFYVLGSLSEGINESRSLFESFSFKQNFTLLGIHSWLRLSEHHTRFFISGQLSDEGAFSGASNPDSSDALLTKVNFKTYKEQHLQWHNDWKTGPDNSLQFGLDFRQLHAPQVILENNFDLADLVNGIFPIRYYGELLATTPVQNKSQRDILGLYSQYQHQVFSKSHLTLGLRYDNFSNIGESISPRFGFVHPITPQQSLKLLYGEAFRAPAENELNLLNNTVILGDKNLKPETVQSWEFIYLAQYSHTSFSGAYFENHFKDAIQRVLVSGDVFQYSNIDQNPVKGLEFESTFELSDHWLLTSTYTHLLEKPTSSFRESDNLASIALNYQHAYWNANLAGNYIGKRNMSTNGSDDNLIELDPYWQWYGKIIYKFNRKLKGYIQVKNIVDTHYESPPYNANHTEGIPSRSRQILSGVSWKF
ncbi:MAG: TonB-dependent receptor [Bermanella sp.]